MHLNTSSYFNLSITEKDIKKIRHAENKEQALDLSLADRFSDYFFHHGAKKDALSFLYELEIQRQTYHVSSNSTVKADALKRARDAYTDFRNSVSSDYWKYVPKNTDMNPVYEIHILNSDGTMTGFVFDFPSADELDNSNRQIPIEQPAMHQHYAAYPNHPVGPAEPEPAPEPALVPKSIVADRSNSDVQELGEHEKIAIRDWPQVERYFEGENHEVARNTFARFLQACEDCRNGTLPDFEHNIREASRLFHNLKWLAKDDDSRQFMVQHGFRFKDKLFFEIRVPFGTSSGGLDPVMKSHKYDAYSKRSMQLYRDSPSKLI